jgi:hypothetical protein
MVGVLEHIGAVGCLCAMEYICSRKSEPLTANHNESDFGFFAGKRSGLKKHMKHVLRVSPCFNFL